MYLFCSAFFKRRGEARKTERSNQPHRFSGEKKENSAATATAAMAIKKNLLVFFTASIAALLAIAFLPTFDTNASTWSVLDSSSKEADLVVTNAIIYTSDSSLPFAEAMAIRDGRIVRIGNHSSVQDLLNDGTNELNLGGKIVVPGFIDSHVHFITGGLKMVQVELDGVNKKDDFVKKVKDYVGEKKLSEKNKDDWILGGGWNNELWGGDLPVASWIDEITPNNPVWLSRMDAHMGLANSLALRMAGITNQTEDPVGGTVVKTSDGEPTGLLIDSAMQLLVPHIPDISVHERKNAVARASKFALMRGVTTVVDFGRFFPGSSIETIWEDFSDVYQWMSSRGEMPIRVCLFFPMETWSRLRDLFSSTGRVLSEWLYLGGVKSFFDGSLGSNSALFYEPYMDEPGNYGLQVTQTDSLRNMALASDKSGLQIAIHAIGDKANDLIVDLYESIAVSNGLRDRRLRVEHAQHLAPGTAARIGQQRIIASVQPDHLLDDAGSAEKKLGKERAETGSYLFGSLFANNVRLAFGSDWPVAKINPLSSIRTALKRIPLGWENPWIPSECLTLVDALNASTISAAHASFLDKDLGSLSPGKLADFVVLSTTSWDELEVRLSASIEATYLGGVRAYPPLT